MIQRSRGLSLPHRSRPARRPPPAIRFVRDPAIAGDEAYRLDVAGRGATHRTRAPTPACSTARSPCGRHSPPRPATRLPALHIDDAPRFGWRGLMLDSARHMQSTAEIRTLIDQMALHKLNVLHWHLVDDQGWRIEIKRYPEFTRIGAWRTPPDAGHDGEPKRYGGFYTQDADPRDGRLRRRASHHHRAGDRPARARHRCGGVVPAVWASPASVRR